MPVNISKNLPARQILESENIFIMSEDRAIRQDIRPLKIIIANLMPAKITTETQLLRLLGNTPLQIEITLLKMRTHTSLNTPEEHLSTFYSTFDKIKNEKFDGLIITGAPVELLPFEEVTYWQELTQIMEWSSQNVFSTLHICWGAQAGLFYRYGIGKYESKSKIFGIFRHQVMDRNSKLTFGFDQEFWAPHSRHTEINTSEILNHPELNLIATSDEAGAYLISSKDNKYVFITGHPEYDLETLQKEYERDLSKGLNVGLPQNYFPNNDLSQKPVITWRSHAFLLYANWLNHYVYQQTPYDRNLII